MMTRVSFVSCLCALVLICGCGMGSGARAAKKGMAAFNAGSYEKAVSYFTQAAQRSPDSPELRYLLGLAHLAAGTMEPAQAAFQAGLDLKPAEGEANLLVGLGQAAYHQKAYADALVALERAFAVAPDDNARARILTVMGAVEASRKNASLARLHYLRALRLDRLYAPAQYNLSALYQDQYDLREEALDGFIMYMRILDLKAQDAQTGKGKAAKKNPLSVLNKVDREHYSLAENRVNRLRAQIDRASAPASRTVVSRNPARAATLLQEGVNAHLAKQYPKAIKAYTDALTADPSTLTAALGLGTVYRLQGQPAESLAAFKNAIAINPTNQEFYHQAAEMALQLRQFAEASRILTRAIARSPNNPMSIRLMSQVAHAEGRAPEAIAYGDFYLSIIPANDPDRAAYEKWVRALKQMR